MAHVVSIVHSSHESTQGNLTCLRPARGRKVQLTSQHKAAENAIELSSSMYNTVSSGPTNLSKRRLAVKRRAYPDLIRRLPRAPHDLTRFLHCARTRRVIKNVLTENDGSLPSSAVE